MIQPLGWDFLYPLSHAMVNPLQAINNSIIRLMAYPNCMVNSSSQLPKWSELYWGWRDLCGSKRFQGGEAESTPIIYQVLGLGNQTNEITLGCGLEAYMFKLEAVS